MKKIVNKNYTFKKREREREKKEERKKGKGGKQQFVLQRATRDSSMSGQWECHCQALSLGTTLWHLSIQSHHFELSVGICVLSHFMPLLARCVIR